MMVSRTLRDGVAPEAAAREPTAVVLDAAADDVRGPEGLLGANFARAGSDLQILMPDGASVVVPGYFALLHPPPLITPSGAALPFDLVAQLAGPRAPGQYAQAEGGIEALVIGRVDALSGQVSVTRADGTRESLETDARVFAGDIIETGADGAIAIIFIDDTTFSLGESGRMVLDALIFDPTSLEGQSLFSVLEGTFVFVSGEIAANNPDQMLVRTPVATIGVRGTRVGGEAAQEGDLNTFLLLPLPGTSEPSGVIWVQTPSRVHDGLPPVFLAEPFRAASVTSVFDSPQEFLIRPDDAIALLGQSLGSLMGDDFLRDLRGAHETSSDADALAGIAPAAGGDSANADPENDPVFAVQPLAVTPLVDPLTGPAPPPGLPRPGGIDPPAGPGGDDDDDDVVVEEELVEELLGIFGTQGDDVLLGGVGPDLIFGLAGNDVLVGLDGNDVLDGAGGADSLFGDDGPNGGANALLGANAIGAGGVENPALIEGLPGLDELDGGDGDDVLDGGPLRDTLRGGGGDDLLIGGPNDVPSDAIDQDNPEFNDGGDFLDGGPGNDSAFGGGGRDTMLGGPGDDFLEGQNDIDTIDGGAGDDLIIGGIGPVGFVINTTDNDLLSGGPGADRFRYLAPSDGTFVAANLTLQRVGDQISDFETGIDTLEIENANFAFGDLFGEGLRITTTDEPYDGTNSGFGGEQAHLIIDSDGRTLFHDFDSATPGYTTLASVDETAQIAETDVVVLVAVDA